MGLISDFLAARRKARIRRALEATMKPDPEYRKRKLSQYSPERRRRYERNVRNAGL